MKPIYKSLALAAMTLQVSLALGAQTYDGTTTSETALPADVLDSLRVELIAPNVSGARDLIKSGECEIDGSNLAITLNAANWIKGATYRVQVVATFGTQTQVIYALDVTVPYYVALSDTPQEYEDTVTVVSTVGDGTGSTITVDPTPTEDSENPVASGGVYTALAGKADGSTYRVGESGDPAVQDIAKVTAHSIELCTSAQALGYHSVAFGSQDAYTQKKTIASGDHAFAHGNACEASGKDAHAEGTKCIASGDYSHAEGDQCTASGESAHAEGEICVASGTFSHAEGWGCAASGNRAHAEGWGCASKGAASHAEGSGTIAAASGQHVSGKYNIEDTNGDYALIIGNGTDGNNRSNAFAIDWNGNLVLFDNGTPVVLTPAKLATLIA